MRFAFLTILVVLGCNSNPSGRPRVEGSVSINGQPLVGRVLVLVCGQDDETFSQILLLDAKGAFKGEVPAAGTYKIVIQESMATMEGAAPADSTRVVFPEKYKLATTSDMTWDIVDGSNSRAIELKN